MVKHWMIGAALAAAVVVNGQMAGAQVTPAQRVLVIPFTTLNVPDSQQWIARGVQENIVADFGRNGGWSPVAFQGQVVVEDNATAARLGRQAAANYAIRGSAQVVGTTVRITAQLIETQSGDTLSTAAVTGSPNDLLRLEDELSNQLRVGPSTTAATGGVTTAPAAQPEPAQPQVIVVTQPNSPALGYDPNYYNNGYGYGYGYGWGYPGVFWPVVIPIDDSHHHHHDDPCPPGPPQWQRPDPRPPMPKQAVSPIPRQVARTPAAGFTLPIPQSGGGFALPIPQSGGGFALPIPQSSPPQRMTQPAQPMQRQMSAPVFNMAPRMMPSAPVSTMRSSPMQYVSFHR